MAESLTVRLPSLNAAAAVAGRVFAYGGATDRQGAAVVDAAAMPPGTFPPEMVIPEMETTLPLVTVKMR